MLQTTNIIGANTIRVSLFGGFCIRSGQREIRDTDSRTHQLWHLMEYLITFRNQVITPEELIEALWPDGDIDNPSNALKNLVYRVRSILHSGGLPHAKEMILYSRGGYRWNNDLPCAVDIEEFESACRQAEYAGQNVDRQIHNCIKAIELYQGDFLPAARFETWVVPISSRLRARFFQCVYTVLRLLQARERYSDMENICRKAIAIDPFEERAHRYLISVLILLGRQEHALRHYSTVTDLFFSEMGVSPSADMRALYREISKTMHDVEIDLAIVKEDLAESGRAEGAFYCEYEVFKNLYRLEARAAARTGQAIFISLVTLEDPSGGALELKLQNKLMDSLNKIIRGGLRQGDVYARFSACQYVLMLHSLTYESCEKVMDRITKRFRELHRNRSIIAYAKTRPLDPIPVDR